MLVFLIYMRKVRFLFLILLLVGLGFFLGSENRIVFAQDCSGCTGPGEYVCGSSWGANDMCCTGGGCPSYECSDDTYNSANNCGGTWMCCLGGAAYPDPCNQSVCTPEWVYLTLGTCEYCPASGGGGGDGGGTTYGQVIGRIWTDVNKNGSFDGVSELWSNSTTTCSTYKNDSFNITVGGVNKLSGWLCNDGGGGVQMSYYRTSDIETGSRSLTLTGVPAGYTCVNAGCSQTLTVAQGDNHIWWQLNKTNTPPTVTLSPTTINYSAGGVVYPVKIGVEDPDPYGQLRISSTTNVGSIRDTAAIEINAYGTSYGGVWPKLDIYGFRKTDGVRSSSPIATITVSSSTRATFWVPIAAYNTYSHFDLVFSNDAWDPVTKTGRHIWIDDVLLHSIPPGPMGTDIYTVQAENTSLIQYDVGVSYNDAYDFMTPARNAAMTSTPGYLLMAWGGSLRLPALWVSPYTATSGNLTFNVYDEPTTSTPVTRSVTIAPVTGTLTGNIWIATGQTVNCSDLTARGSHPSIPITVTANPQALSGAMNGSTGNYSVPGLFGTINTVSLTGAGLTPSTGSYTNACVNTSPYTVSGFTYNGSLITPSKTLDIGLRLVDAKKWIAAQGGDIYASKFTLNLPKACPNPLSVMCPNYSPQTATHYALGYNPLASSVFSAQPVSIGPSRFSESNISATNLGNQFASKNSLYFKKTLVALVTSLKDTNKITSFTTSSTSFPNSNYIMALDASISSAPSNYSYSVGGSAGLVFMIIPPKTGSPFVINNISTGGSSRLVIIADRDIEIGNQIPGTTADPKSAATTPHIKASIITTGNITFKNNPIGASSSPGTLIIEGPLISGATKGTDFGIKLERDLTSISNELRPAVFVRFNPFYITELNKIAVGNLLPALNDFFVFDYAQN